MRISKQGGEIWTSWRTEKDKLKRMNSLLILKIMSTTPMVFFFYEFTISMTTFKRSKWWLKEDPATLNHRSPETTWTLNIVSSVSQSFFFQLSSDKYLKEDVAEFSKVSIMHIRSVDAVQNRSFLILDHAPNNRSSLMFKLAARNIFAPVFITAGCPKKTSPKVFSRESEETESQSTLQPTVPKRR